MWRSRVVVGGGVGEWGGGVGWIGKQYYGCEDAAH